MRGRRAPRSRAEIVGPEAERFRDVAVRFVALVDEAQGDPDAWLDRVAPILLELHARALELPYVDDGSPVLGSREHAAWQALFGRLGAFLGPRSDYWSVFDPTDERDHGSVAGSLADDLADVYFELTEGLAAWNAGRLASATWHWRFGFWSHWGEHATDASRTIYWLRRRSREMDAPASG